MDQEVPRTTSPTPPPPPPPPPPTTDSPPLSPTSSSLANSRWTPTKEQIAVLEGLYTQGLRTPNAEQIQQITARLREHGHIEGKNVFYWFQNHKARQRQKQKQQSFAYFSRLFRRPPSMPPPVLARPPPPPPAFPVRLPRPPPVPTCNNVIYRPPCYIPSPQAAANAAYYAQPQRPVFPRMEMAHDQRPAPPPTTMEQTALGYANAPRPSHRPANGDGDTATVGSLETLQLFPLQPTFVLPDETRRSGSGYLTSSASASSGSEESESPEGREHGERPQFFDFFGVHSGRP